MDNEDVLHKMQSENVLLLCKPENSLFPANQDFTVTWSSGKWEFLALSTLRTPHRNTNQSASTFKEEELINSRDFSLTVKDLCLSDSGEYLCNISSGSNYLTHYSNTACRNTDQERLLG